MWKGTGQAAAESLRFERRSYAAVCRDDDEKVSAAAASTAVVVQEGEEPGTMRGKGLSSWRSSFAAACRDHN